MLDLARYRYQFFQEPTVTVKVSFFEVMERRCQPF